MQLTETALGNRQTRRSHLCIASEIRVRLLMDRGDWSAVAPRDRPGLDRCARTDPYTVQFFIENILRFATCRDKMIETLDAARAATLDDNRRRTLDRAYAGMGGFDIDKLLGGDERDEPRTNSDDTVPADLDQAGRLWYLPTTRP